MTHARENSGGGAGAAGQARGGGVRWAFANEDASEDTTDLLGEEVGVGRWLSALEMLSTGWKHVTRIRSVSSRIRARASRESYPSVRRFEHRIPSVALLPSSGRNVGLFPQSARKVKRGGTPAQRQETSSGHQALRGESELQHHQLGP